MIVSSIHSQNGNICDRDCDLWTRPSNVP